MIRVIHSPAVWRTLALGILLVASPSLQAHPVPRDTHDRTIVVHFTHDAASGQDFVVVNYRLEADELTIALEDLDAFKDQIDASRYGDKRDELYSAFTRFYAPILADNLSALMNGKALQLHCVQHEHTLLDEHGQPLGHVRCDFVFRAAFESRVGAANEFHLREGNYLLQNGRIDLALANDAGVVVLTKTEPTDELKKRAETQQRPGDDARLRQLSARFSFAGPTAPAAVPPDIQPARVSHDGGLFRLFLDSEHGFVVLLLLAAGLGAIHALTPGHGKTLVAAYLVGEQGTIGHAILLGLVTTVTHTGAVLVFALGLQGMSAAMRGQVLSGLELGMGLLVASMGFWMLLRRLAGQADHFHLPGQGHHHHHGRADHHHDHDAAGRVLPRERTQQPVGWWGLIVLGVSGGMVPCLDAVALLLVAVGMNLLWLAVPLLLAFSAGLAGVLVLIGIVVVQAKNYAQSRLGEGRLVRALPLFSAVVITAMGLWLCYQSVQGDGSQPPLTATHGNP